MANIDRIVNVLIALRTSGVVQQSFSDLLLIGEHSGTNRAEIITSADDLLETPFSLTTSSALYKAAQVFFSQIPHGRQLYIGKRNTAEAAGDTIAAIAAENSDWYGFSDVSHVEADMLAYAAWAEANTKMFFTAIAASDAIGTGTSDIATALKNGNYFRTAWWYHPTITEFPEVAIASKSFTKLPGGETWANQQLAGVTVTSLTETDYTNLKAKNGNSFEPFRNINMTQNGKTAGGEWIDVIRFRDWLVEEIRTEVLNLFIDNRVPYTDKGIAAVRQRMIAALDLGVRRGGIAPEALDPDNGNRVIPSYTTVVPALAQISSSDKAARLLRDVTFVARLAGAIHAVEIRGELTYDNIG